MTNTNISAKQRMAMWKNLPEPKPDWCEFKRLMRDVGQSPQEIFLKWLEWSSKKERNS